MLVLCVNDVHYSMAKVIIISLNTPIHQTLNREISIAGNILCALFKVKYFNK